MRRTPVNVMGVVIPAPRHSFRAALWFASALSVPAFLLLFSGEMLMRWLL
ncbi:hypothetical protein [Tropicimonas sp. IMCC6043]|nr:hypothetical protein [Tropicimonas sp. IMCC6043]